MYYLTSNIIQIIFSAENSFHGNTEKLSDLRCTASDETSANQDVAPKFLYHKEYIEWIREFDRSIVASSFMYRHLYDKVARISFLINKNSEICLLEDKTIAYYLALIKLRNGKLKVCFIGSLCRFYYFQNETKPSSMHNKKISIKHLLSNLICLDIYNNIEFLDSKTIFLLLEELELNEMTNIINNDEYFNSLFALIIYNIQKIFFKQINVPLFMNSQFQRCLECFNLFYFANEIFSNEKLKSIFNNYISKNYQKEFLNCINITINSAKDLYNFYDKLVEIVFPFSFSASSIVIEELMAKVKYNPKMQDFKIMLFYDYKLLNPQNYAKYIIEFPDNYIYYAKKLIKVEYSFDTAIFHESNNNIAFPIANTPVNILNGSTLEVTVEEIAKETVIGFYNLKIWDDILTLLNVIVADRNVRYSNFIQFKEFIQLVEALAFELLIHRQVYITIKPYNFKQLIFSQYQYIIVIDYYALIAIKNSITPLTMHPKFQRYEGLSKIYVIFLTIDNLVKDIIENTKTKNTYEKMYSISNP